MPNLKLGNQWTAFEISSTRHYSLLTRLDFVHCQLDPRKYYNDVLRPQEHITNVCRRNGRLSGSLHNPQLDSLDFESDPVFLRLISPRINRASSHSPYVNNHTYLYVIGLIAWMCVYDPETNQNHTGAGLVIASTKETAYVGHGYADFSLLWDPLHSPVLKLCSRELICLQEIPNGL